jgi:hypothetical protein
MKKVRMIVLRKTVYADFANRKRKTQNKRFFNMLLEVVDIITGFIAKEERNAGL